MPKNKTNSVQSDAGSAIKAILLISAVVIAVLMIVGGIYLAGLYGSRGDGSKEGVENDKHFSAFIEKNGDNNAELSDMVISQDEFVELFLLYKGSSSYYHECTVKLSGQGGEAVERNKRIIKNGEKFNVRTYRKNTLLETIKCDGERIMIINETTGESYVIPAKGQSLYSLAGIPDHGEIKRYIEEYLKADSQDTSVLSECAYLLERTRDENILTLNLTYRETGILEKYEYYLDSGIIYRCESTYEISGKKITPYQVTTTYFKNDPSDMISEDSFLIDD